MLGQDRSEVLVERVRAAIAQNRPLAPCGGGSKAFYGNPVAATALDVTQHRGILGYDPKERVLHVRAGTSLDEIDRVLARQNQMIAFDPPRYGPGTTIGGAVAAGLTGVRRPYGAAMRDHVLGVQFINGYGEIVDFGGQFVRSRGGFDLTRLLVGSLGTLGVILSLILRVTQQPERELTVVQELSAETALTRLVRLAGRSLPITGSCWHNGSLFLRLGGSAAAVDAAKNQIGGETLRPWDTFWQKVRDHALGFFAVDQPLWRFGLPPATPALGLGGEWLFEWDGQLRWLKGNERAGRIRQLVAASGGHATLFRGQLGDVEVFHPLSESVFATHRNVKLALDPQRIFNPGRMYFDL